MKKTYTKKQIQEAISYWEKCLNENLSRPKKLKLEAQFSDPIGVDELYEPETISDLGVDPGNCAVRVIFDGDKYRDPHPVCEVEVRPHPTFDGDVIVLKLDEDDPMEYGDFYSAVKESTGENLAILAEIDGNLYAAYTVAVSENDKMADQFYIVVKQQDRL